MPEPTRRRTQWKGRGKVAWVLGVYIVTVVHIQALSVCSLHQINTRSTNVCSYTNLPKQLCIDMLNKFPSLYWMSGMVNQQCWDQDNHITLTNWKQWWHGKTHNWSSSERCSTSCNKHCLWSDGGYIAGFCCDYAQHLLFLIFINCRTAEFMN